MFRDVKAMTLRSAAMHWYSRGVVSQEKASQIAGLDRKDFLLSLAANRVEVFTVDIEDLRREIDRG